MERVMLASVSRTEGVAASAAKETSVKKTKQRVQVRVGICIRPNL
jgi:hypothetical protein